MCGVCYAGITITLAIFLSEISDDHSRGKFGCAMGIFTPLSQLYGYAMGHFFSIKYFTLSSALPLLIGIILLLFFVPDSPVHLLHKNKKFEAIRSLKKFRGHLSPREIEKDIEVMEYALAQTTSDRKSWNALFSYQHTRRGLLIGFGMVLLQNASGVGVLFSFMASIFEEAQTSLSGNMIGILVCSIKICIYFFVVILVEKLGRKPLLLTSSILCSIPLFVIGFYFFIKEHKIGDYQSYSWLAVVSMLFYVVAYSIGLGAIPIATVSELFPADVRSTAFSTISFSVTIFNTLYLSGFPIVIKHVGISSCMWMFSVNCVLGSIFVYCMMPETKGKSIFEIQEILKGKRNNRIS